MTRAVDIAELRRRAAEALYATATVARAVRTTNAWGERERTATSTRTYPCAFGERTRLVVGDAAVGTRATQSVLLPYDADVALGDEVTVVTGPGTESVAVRGRVARVTRHPVLTLVELGAEE
ncbi:hypothetical protein OO015_13760 (plasmid) [Thermomicrobium sp. 4228-Ro]|uniref:hypothetical protein n=1 Tax=Thermomicrobium sp. 4228-Ro TaxID=2993937 RepID=UPI002248E1AB|nr:hypothetical protein [Thermomicrobium sp. 4228-Ro]MCX2728551.1 hypothetical protein [Thermomicrobium sp. 4228-Ro]